MATLRLSSTPPPSTISIQNQFTNLSSLHLKPPKLTSKHRRRSSHRHHTSNIIRSHKVVIEHKGETKTFEVEPDETILEKALDIGLSVPHDCKLGVCMTCPAKLVSGEVDQSDGMLSDDVVECGYALLCVAYPRSDCHIKTIPEEELLAMQLVTAND